MVKNPSRFEKGQVWTQNQCFSHPDIKAALGTTRPENIVKLSEDKLWVIEAKSDKGLIGRAISEAMNDYAVPINRGGRLKALIATGVAGNEQTGYLVQTRILLGGQWESVTINGQEATGFLAPKDVDSLITQQVSDVKDYAPPPKAFLDAAERINGYLHMGGINKNDRAKHMAALLLSVIDEPGPNVDAKLPVLIEEINTRAKLVLNENDKGEYAPFITIIPPPNKSNHFKYKLALIRTLQELRDLNIRSAMNSSTDVLGQFYEVFLKYGNGAKEIGIILTPRHVTRFAAEALGLSPKDIVLDPACGTGGFLVAAFDYARRNFTADEVEWFRKNGLFGVEQEPTVAVLAIVNMIFRGDGKHNIIEGNCFMTYFEAKTKGDRVTAQQVSERPAEGLEPITRVLMNPPFALKDSAEKEFFFVSHALSLMHKNGLLFSLLPLDAMFGTRAELNWRRNELLKQNTLLAVLSFPAELFSPAASKQVVGVIIKKGQPHRDDAPVFWGCIAHDGHLIIKRKRLPASELVPPRTEADQLAEVLPHLQAFIEKPSANPVNIPQLCKTAPIDFGDMTLELLPEAYVESREPTPAELEESADEMARETVAFLVKFRREKRLGDYDAKT